MKSRTIIIIVVALCLTLFWIFGIPVIFSAVTGVPLWYLWPLGRPLSLLPSQGILSVKVSPIAPEIIGQSVVVTVLDASNKTPITNAVVEINEGSYGILNRTTGSDGTTQFPYIGATTQIIVSKNSYADSDPIVIPQIPAVWVTTRNYNTATLDFGLFGTWGLGLFLYWKQKKK